MARWLSDLSLRAKLVLIIAPTATIGLLGIGAIYASVQARAAWQNASARIAGEAHAAAQAIVARPHNQAVVERSLATLRSDPAVRAAVFLENGGQPAADAQHAGAAGEDTSVRQGTAAGSLSATAFDVAATSPRGSSGTVHVDADFSAEIDSALASCRGFLLACSGITVLLATALFWLLEGLLRSPVTTALGELRQFRSGDDLSKRVAKQHSDEFGGLMDEINALLEQRESGERSLRAHKTEFERRVRERTRELDAAVAEARDATKRAEGASRAKGDFLAHMSHEIRTPLNGVMGMAELLQHSSTLDERQRRYAVVIHQSGKALLQLINDVLDFSKIEAGKLELARERFCVRDMVEDALEILAERAQSKGLELICDIPVELDTLVFADSLRLRQVVINLVSNAVKFTERGDIAISVRAEPGIESTMFTFEVTDTGIGIDPANCATIFDAFVQADTSTWHRYSGTGLGLAISKQLVELMGGSIGVKSAIGVGSTFHFSVPLAVDRTGKREKTSSMLATTQVLIVEKSSAARRILRQHLKSWGAVATELGSVEEALRRLRTAFSGEFEILVIDAHLAGSSAAATVAAVREIQEFAETPILLMHTGSGEPPEAHTIKGPVAWQSKPIRRSQLQSTLERLVRKARGERTQSVVGPAAAAGGPTTTLHRARVRRVLLVEDNPVNREVARAMLQSLAVQVFTACSGKEALEKLASASYDVVIMDCQMPEIDGYETTRRYRQWELRHGRARTPVVALTANALSGDAERCFAAGMDHYVTKPFTIEQLHIVLESCTQTPADAADQRAAAAEVLDAKTLSRIHDLSAGGRPDLIARLAELYAASSEKLVEALRVAATNEDVETLGRSAHALKSSSANVGATTLAATCLELEVIARQSNVAVPKTLVERLIGEHQEVMRALRNWRTADADSDTSVPEPVAGPQRRREKG